MERHLGRPKTLQNRSSAMTDKYLMHRVKNIEYLGNYTLRVAFPDGFTGEINLAPALG
jgi:hypothetical protein